MKKLALNEVQDKSLEILKKIDEICEKEHLVYFLAYGTLIGAIRHKGFIPWDDDVDIMMPRPDYEKLLKYFKKHKEELRPFKLFHPALQKDYPYMIARISDSRYVLDVDNEKSYGIGLFVDVYPLDGAGKTMKEAVALKEKVNRYISMCFLSTRESVKRENTQSILKLIAKYPAFLLAKCAGKEYYMSRIDDFRRQCSYQTSNYVGCVIWGSDDGVKGIFPKEWFSKTINVRFGDNEYKAPKEYDKILRKLYGDYMQLPPKDQQIAHHYYDAYIKNKDVKQSERA